jgi:hypothetical protein
VGIAIEGKQTACIPGPTRKDVVEVLPRGIAVQLDGDVCVLGRGEYLVPLGDDARARP